MRLLEQPISLRQCLHPRAHGRHRNHHHDHHHDHHLLLLRAELSRDFLQRGLSSYHLRFPAPLASSIGQQWRPRSSQNTKQTPSTEGSKEGRENETQEGAEAAAAVSAIQRPQQQQQHRSRSGSSSSSSSALVFASHHLLLLSTPLLCSAQLSSPRALCQNWSSGLRSCSSVQLQSVNLLPLLHQHQHACSIFVQVRAGAGGGGGGGDDDNDDVQSAATYIGLARVQSLLLLLANLVGRGLQQQQVR
ncbi:hypothetical protein AXG93_872s1180 [Marchantia polymorpha subsp. ruderalis]|uniref:Uncharacterized protein n=1 Tax=Marchantia polymorpha subsp. ruderalis TaxID=1480154 RepID=A0A176VJM0_MARPO|nr:hypothetical protein AXG93_872s1180 [Marchantia polymorpha subsp. ruderalis]